MTTLDATPFGFRGSGYDESSQANVYEARLEVDGTPVTCQIVKPAGGISFYGESLCR